MADFLNLVLFAMFDFSHLIQSQFSNRAIWEWILFFMPVFIFGEFPRYIFPTIFLYVAKICGRLPQDEEQKKIFFATNPSVSVLLVGYNEEASVAQAIRSLLELRYPNLEIIVIDDNSEDRMYEEARPFADQGLVKLYRNSAATGRSGRPTASNMAFYLATGDYIVSVDADTSFDRDMLLHMIGPFYDSRVGGVAGNLKVRNIGASIWTRLQAIEYALSISMWKRWLGFLGMGMQVSGAFGAFRRESLTSFGAWDPELAEDADLTLKIKKVGWKIVFAPAAIAMTNAPDTWRVLRGQRFRWDKGGFRTYFRKHVDIMKFWTYDWRNAFELSLEFFFTVFLTFIYAVYLILMLIFYPKLLIFVLCFAYIIYVGVVFLCFAIALVFSERRDEEVALFPTVFFFPGYKALFRWVRFGALLLEIFRINYQEGYLPESAWRNTKKW
ncbi:glycosyltransferase family 2 protein [Desulfoluna sp.]|uniref:glycosyltransferase family 2 protein n=1 Tax=Desulfoluna sp. TaxID=2045199 RepID=UPI00262EA4C0|nr:glycosyltransferase [Desulfoluna sp.]